MINIVTFTPKLFDLAENINTIFCFQNKSYNEGSFPDAWWRKQTFIVEGIISLLINFVVFFFILHLFADQTLEFVCVSLLFLYASFVIYISMIEIIWVRVNYKVMSVWHHFQQYFSYVVSVSL
jgi:hypothetical protein